LLSKSGVEQVSKLGVRIVLLHLLQHLQQLQRLRLGEIYVAMQLLTHVLDYLAVSMIR
jgi:hypothetical protein